MYPMCVCVCGCKCTCSGSIVSHVHVHGRLWVLHCVAWTVKYSTFCYIIIVELLHMSMKLYFRLCSIASVCVCV